MGRMENATWDTISPVLGSYGILDPGDIDLVKKTLETMLPKDREGVRGVPDLIGRALGERRMTEAISYVKTANEGALGRATSSETKILGREDTRSPKTIRDGGGLWGWSKGLLSLDHAKQVVRKMQAMKSSEQTSWIDQWKRPGPPSEEANPYVATGLGSGQKAGYGYTIQLPLTWGTRTGQFRVATDTGNLDNANIVAVQLVVIGGVGAEGSKEVLVLTGIPWRYITEVEYQNNRLSADTAADTWTVDLETKTTDFKKLGSRTFK